jgi:hypothetical protein
LGKRGKAQSLDITINSQIEYYTSPQPNWDEIYFDWIAWSLPIDDFYNYPATQIIKVWQGVKKAKAQEQNAQSMASANIAYMVYEYIRDHNKSIQKTIWDFLPYDLKTVEQSQMIDKETAITIIKARNNGDLPPNILKYITQIPNLYEAILLMGNQTDELSEN